ncbi:MAG: hypothetical protein RRY79_07340 [Clostridia bacterium]
MRKDVKTKGRHYYISRKALTAQQLLHHARMERSVDSMYCLLDVSGEDSYRVADKNTQRKPNMLRKLAINIIKTYKDKHTSKPAISQIMFYLFIRLRGYAHLAFRKLIPVI